MRRLSVTLPLLILVPSFGLALEVPINVKESAGVGTQGFPVTVVIPLADGQYTSTSTFGISDSQGSPVPAQFEVLERDWIEEGAASNNSILHVAAHFQVTVGPGGTALYRFRDTGNVLPADPVSVSDSGGSYTVTTGPLRFTVDKSGFNILDTVWYDANDDGDYLSGERIIIPSSDHGARIMACDQVGANNNCSVLEDQSDTEQAPDECEVEESGPMRVVVRCERYTDYSGVNDHEHGSVTRIYAYAGKPWVKIDYQLVNAATGPTLDGGQFSNPWYFDSVELEWDLELTGSPTVTTSTEGGTVDARTLDANGVEFGYTLHDEFAIRHADGSPSYDSCADVVADAANECDTAGYLDVTDASWGVQTVIRNMWELWPNGIEVTDATDYTLQVQLWPEWSSQWKYGTNALDTTACGSCSFAGVYWLDDQRAVYKEVLLNFHGASPNTTTLTNIAKTFDRGPVGIVNLSDLETAGVTYDGASATVESAYAGGGLLDTYSNGDLTQSDEDGYRAGWQRWYPASITRLVTPFNTGGSPSSGEELFYFGAAETYWERDRLAISELNARPQWMGRDYTYADDWAALGLTQTYRDDDWRPPNNTESYRIAGSSKYNLPMDDQHFWAYHLMDHYWASGNLWLKDWLTFAGEFRRPRLLQTEVSPDEAHRAVGHTLENAFQAYRVTGDTTLMDEIVDYVAYLHSTRMEVKCGELYASVGSGNPTAFMARALYSIMERLEDNDREGWSKLFTMMSALVEYIQHWNKYGYHASANCVENTDYGGGASWNVPDVNSWYYWHTGKARIKSDNDAYVNHPTAGPYGGTAFFPFSGWDGRWAGRYYWWENAQTRTDTTPPSTVSSLTANLAGSTLSISWNPPDGASYYLIVWSDRMLEECTSNCANDPQSTDTTNYRNWWAAESYACDASACNGSVSIETSGSTEPTHVALFGFDDANNMSSMSNVALVVPGSLEPPLPPSRLRVDP